MSECSPFVELQLHRQTNKYGSGPRRCVHLSSIDKGERDEGIIYYDASPQRIAEPIIASEGLVYVSQNVAASAMPFWSRKLSNATTAATRDDEETRAG